MDRLLIRRDPVTGLCLDAMICQRLGRYQTKGANSDWQGSVGLGEYPMVGSYLDLRVPKRLGRSPVMGSII